MGKCTRVQWHPSILSWGGWRHLLEACTDWFHLNTQLYGGLYHLHINESEGEKHKHTSFDSPKPYNMWEWCFVIWHQVMVEMLDPKDGTRHHTNSLHFTFTCPDGTAPLPRVLPETYAEAMDYIEGRRRHMRARSVAESLGSKLVQYYGSWTVTRKTCISPESVKHIMGPNEVKEKNTMAVIQHSLINWVRGTEMNHFAIALNEKHPKKGEKWT